MSGDRPRAQVNIGATKTRFTELLKQVESGEEIVITRSGKPVAKFQPEAEAKAGL